MTRRRFAIAVVIAACGAPPASAHITPVVVMRKQADVIRETLPGAVSYAVSTVKLSRTTLEQIETRAHYTPDLEEVRFYTGKNAAGTIVGTVVFPQIETMHGPIEVGVTIGPNNAITSVLATRATAETQPWVLEVERAGVINRLKGETVSEGPRRVDDSHLGGMSGHMADVMATAAFRALTLKAVLLP